jgi:hypothetical protein
MVELINSLREAEKKKASLFKILLFYCTGRTINTSVEYTEKLVYHAKYIIVLCIV